MPVDTASALKLWVVMTRAVRSIEAPLRRQVEAHGLSLTEFGVLEVLLHKGTLAIGEIGSSILLTSGSMTYVVDKLAERGLLQRRACESDRRVVYAELTQQGRALIEAVFREHEVLLHDLMRGLQPEEQEAASELLKRLGLYAHQHGNVPPSA
jgi:MarR family 2-MHQ and catechol resistance regulon transcriptional repressor